MTATAAPTVKDQELVSFGLIESASVNSITDFTHSKSYESNVEDNNDFSNTFICHLIFYMFFCVSLFLHIFIDLGLGSFIKRIFIRFYVPGKKTVFEKKPVFA